MIYVISDQRGHFKVGKARDPIARMRTLQTGMPTKLALVACADWPNRAEGRIHRMLQAHRAVGEWFRYCPHIDSLIKHMHSGGELEAWFESLSNRPARLARLLRIAG